MQPMRPKSSIASMQPLPCTLTPCTRTHIPASPILRLHRMYATALDRPHGRPPHLLLLVTSPTAEDAPAWSHYASHAITHHTTPALHHAPTAQLSTLMHSCSLRPMHNMRANASLALATMHHATYESTCKPKTGCHAPPCAMHHHAPLCATMLPCRPR